MNTKIKFTFLSSNKANTTQTIEVNNENEIHHGFGSEFPLEGLDWKWELKNNKTPKELGESIMDSYNNWSIEEGNTALEYFGECVGFEIL